MTTSETEYHIRERGNITYVTATRNNFSMTYFRLGNGAWFMEMPTGPEGEDVQINDPVQSKYLNSIIDDSKKN